MWGSWLFNHHPSSRSWASRCPLVLYNFLVSIMIVQLNILHACVHVFPCAYIVHVHVCVFKQTLCCIYFILGLRLTPLNLHEQTRAKTCFSTCTFPLAYIMSATAMLPIWIYTLHVKRYHCYAWQQNIIVSLTLTVFLY